MTMREILFRGKRHKDYGEGWVYGVPFFDYAGDCIMKDDASEKVIYPDTVGQYTGLTDKNGKKIFEGDVVKRCFTLTRGPNKESRETQVGVVRYDNVTCGYLIRGACNLRRQWPGDTIEVIGNIHDNPELMEGE